MIYDIHYMCIDTVSNQNLKWPYLFLDFGPNFEPPRSNPSMNGRTGCESL